MLDPTWPQTDQYRYMLKTEHEQSPKSIDPLCRVSNSSSTFKALIASSVWLLLLCFWMVGNRFETCSVSRVRWRCFCDTAMNRLWSFDVWQFSRGLPGGIPPVRPVWLLNHFKEGAFFLIIALTNGTNWMCVTFLFLFFFTPLIVFL